VDLHVIGAGPSYTDRAGAVGASYLVGDGGHHLLFDLGHGAFAGLAGRLDPADLDAVLISHLHPDHFIDLVALRHYLRWEPPGRRRVRVIGPAGLAERMDALHAEPGFTAEALDVERLEPGRLLIGGFVVDAARVTHTDSSFGFRVAAPYRPHPGLVYSDHCGRSADLAALGGPRAVLLSEVSFGPGPVAPDAFHLDGPMVGTLARSSGAGRVLLTHLQMGFDRNETVATVRARFDGPVDLVDPGFTTTI
jgi:ribonuclease BN (tRNA processing enzyme)